MESWVLDGDSYSFLRSSPRNINLQHLDGPNRVEIFDITNIPSHRSAISETTCLCDIFGDDCEAPSLSSSPAAASSLKKVADEQCEDVNDSSGSYHTANGSENLSDGSDAFEDSKDTKDSILSETGKSNTQACDLTLPNEEREVSSTSNGSFKPEGNWQESQLLQDTGLERVENSSDQQLVTSTSEFRDTKIRVTGSTQEIISADLLSKIKGIRDHTTSTELRETDSLDSSLANRDIQRNNTTSEVRENDSPQENKDSLKSLASEDTPEENNDLSCSGEEEEQISLPDILLTKNNPTLESDFSVSLTNYSNDGLDFTPFQKTDLSAKDETHDLRGMSAPLEHDEVPNKSTCVGTFLCDDKAGMSDLKDPNTLSPPTYVEDNSGTDEASMPQHFTISSETTETVLFDEQRSLTPFSVPTEKLTSCVISESCSPSGSSVDVDCSEPPIIIYSPVGFSLCPSPEPKKTCLTGPEDFESTPDCPESEYRLTPTDGGSVSSFDSKLCPTPESRSVTSTPENNPNAFIYELSPAASSAELRSASCSPEMKITTYSSQNQQSLQIKNNDFPSQNEVLAQNHDLEEIICAEGFMSTTLPGKEFADRTVPTIYNLSSAQGEKCSLSTTLPRDTESPDLKGTRYAKSPMSIMLPTNKTISSNVSMDKCTIVPHSAEQATVSPDVHEITFVENSISTIQIPANKTTNMATSPVSNLSSTEEGITRSPFTSSISGGTSSPDVFRAKSTENSIPNTLFTKDNENMFSSPILDSLSTKGGISRPPSNGSAPRDTGSPDGIVCVENPASTTLLTNEPTFLAISPLSTPFQCSTASNVNIPEDTMSPDVEATTVQNSMSTIVPINEIENVVITHLSSTEGGISKSPSTLTSLTRDAKTPDIAPTNYLESLLKPIVFTNDNTNKISSTEGAISRPSTSPGVSRNTVSPCIDKIRCEEIHTSTTDLTNMGSKSSGDSCIHRDTMCLDIEKTTYMDGSNEIWTNEMTNRPNSAISTEGCISRSPSPPSISKTTVFTAADGLRSIESPISTIPPENKAPNIEMSPTDGGLPNPAFIKPRDTMFPDLEKSGYGERSEEILTQEIANDAILNISNFSSTEGSKSRLSPTSNVPRDTMCPEGIGCVQSSTTTILPANISPVYNYSLTEEGISRQPANLYTSNRDSTSAEYEGTTYNEGSNCISINEIKNMSSSISKPIPPSVIMTDRLSSLTAIYQGKPNHILSAPEPCMPLGYIDNHLLFSKKVDSPLMVLPNVGQKDDTGCKMSLKNGKIPQDNCTIITSLPHSQTEKINDLSPEPPAPKLSVKQIKANWEKMNENILNSLNPWEKSKKTSTVPVAKDSNDSGNVSERELVGSAKTFGPIGMRPREIPGVLHSNNHSMYEGQSCRNKGWSGKRVIQEEHALEKGVGNLAEGSYREEQVDLSFSTRNRKGPANHSPAPSSRDPKSGIPPRYFESPLATQEQQSLLRAQNLQKENNNSARRVRSSFQGNYCGARYLSLESTSETSNMGSEFDAADTEVKWFTDQAFRGLSSPQVDYLDVYNSSRESSTNVSQPSTVDSPGSATWISYADLHDSLHENDNALCHTAAFLPSGTLNPAKRFEMGSFECVDVAVESKEETKRGKKTVPKRQIQFKRRNIDESGVKAMDSLSTETCAREAFVRQHSTPASMQEDLAKGNHEIQTGKKILQKSASLDECPPKSKIASTVIKSVLSKKMDTATNESLKSEQCEDKKKYNETLSAMELCNAERPSSRVPSEYSLSSEDFAGNEERSPHPSRRKYGPPKVPPKPFFKPNSIPTNNNPAGVVFQDKPFVKDQIQPIMVDAIKSKISKQQGSTEKEASKLGETFSSESGSASNRAPNCTAVCVASTLSSVNNHRMTPETCKQQESSNSMFLSKTPEITLKPCAIKDKNKSSTKASVCPEPQTSNDTLCEPQLEETLEEQMSSKPGLESENEEDIEKSKAKSVIHKVRDVRKLVKNTYNLSFKASNTTHVEDVQQKMQPENPHPLQIECKAISWKDKTSSCSKSTTQQDVEEMSNKSKHSQKDSPQENDVGITKITAKTSLPNVQYSDMDFLDKCSKVSKSGNSERPAQLKTPPRPSSKEISTLVFLQDSTPKSTQKPTIPASPSAKIANNSHSVSMLRKEKGMQADIGVCDVLSEGAGAKPKHINRLEVPLQTYASGETSSELQKGEKEVVDSSPEQKTSLNNGLQTSRGILQVRSSPKPKEVKILPTGKAGVKQSQPSNEQEITFATESKAEVRTISNNAKVHAMAITTSKEIELPIQVRSISSDRPKPSVMPKPNYKQPFAEIRSTSADITPTSFLKEQTNLKSDVKIIETSATVIHNEQPDNTASSHTKTLAVSAVSSHKPQTTPLTTMSSSVQKSTASTSRQEVSITSIQNSSNQQQQNNQEQMTSLYQTSPVVSQTDTNMQHAIRTSTNNDFRFPTSDDPPSYDERESFSPLHVSDLPPRRQNRYHPTTKHSVCSCTSCAQPQFGNPYHSSQNQTPPVPHSPGQVISYPGAPPQAQVRPHKCRPDGQPLNYTSVSPKTAVQQSPAMVQPMHHSHTCPAPGIQLYGNEQQQSSTQHMERRSGNQRSPQAPSGATYREHSRSPSIAALDTRSHFFNPQELPPAFGNEYGSDGSGNGGMLYPENASGLGYGQGPRRVLLDPETGKYFYIEVPMQPLRKMLFDPEIGQYVEVLIPQQAMSNSSMYPPTSAPYQGPYHGQGLYASQYLPYSMPPHPQSAQQPRHPEPSVPTSLHQNTMGYGSSASQAPKSDVKGHPSLDQSYLESMYYIPTGINASPNSTPSDCYHKPATNMPAAGGRRA
ncbi:hypothetical protein C0J50_15697 [Silurus asotus]|uniref:DUF4585 domain-containing protein n=1 Tax=Silurus asotus TaxID=30991 RepID=A0AAD5AYR2_SILAS|nr:hypothetical protein C0J50_15697 [Silurus asotus]